MDAVAKPQGCTHFRLRQLARLVGRQYDAEVGKCGLKTTQYSLLSHVMHLGPVRPGDLAQAMGLDASTLTRNLKPMAAAGWIEQGAGDDARSRSISITAAGRSKRSEAQRHWRRAQDKLNEMLGVERVLALQALLDDSIGMLQAQGECAQASIDG
jgi:DNA-binding MarR family transcriptional regulator